MKLSAIPQAEIKHFLQSNQRLKEELLRKSQTKTLLFSIQVSYQYLVDIFNHLEKLTKLDLSDEKSKEQAWKYSKAAFAAMMQTQYYISAPRENYNNSSLTRSQISTYTDHLQFTDKVADKFIGILQTLVPAFSEIEKTYIGRLQTSYTEIINHSLPRRKPNGIAYGGGLVIWGDSRTKLFMTEIGFENKGSGAFEKLSNQIPQHIFSELGEFMISTYANLIDLVIMANGGNQFPQAARIHFSNIINSESSLSMGIISCDGDKVFEDFKAQNPELINDLNKEMLVLFERFFNSRIVPYLTKEQREAMHYLGGNFSFKPSSSVIAENN